MTSVGSELEPRLFERVVEVRRHIDRIILDGHDPIEIVFNLRRLVEPILVRRRRRQFGIAVGDKVLHFALGIAHRDPRICHALQSDGCSIVAVLHLDDKIITVGIIIIDRAIGDLQSIIFGEAD